MRRAEVEGAWNDVESRDRGFRLSRVKTTGKPPLGAFDEELPNGLVVLAGLNGVGKTTLLRLMRAALGGGEAGLRDTLKHDGDFELSVQADGGELRSPLDPSAPVAVTVLDAASECARLQSAALQPNFEDLLEGVDPREWTDKERDDARFVVGKTYDFIRVTEFEAPVVTNGDDAQNPLDADSDEVLSAIEVSEGGVAYDFRTMGLGELAALTLLWRLQRVKANTVLLVEEPETYLSARGSAAFLSILARVINSKRLYAAVTTHSPGVLRQAPAGLVRLLLPGESAMVVREPQSTAEVEAVLGIPSGPSRLVLVEDLAALDFVKELLARYSGAWVGAVDCVPTGGEEAIIDICRKLPVSTRLRVVGVLDGDQTAPADARWPVFTLPGEQGPDVLLRDATLADLPGFAKFCQRNVGNVSAVFLTRAGENAHDWFIEVARDLGLDVHTFRRYAVGQWLRLAANRKVATKLVDDITGAFAASVRP